MFKALFTIAALIATFMGVGFHAVTEHAHAGAVATEIATIRDFEAALGEGAFTEDLGSVPTSLAFEHTVIVEADFFVIVTRDSNGTIWVSAPSGQPSYIGALTAPVAESEVVGSYGFESDRLVPAINAFVSENIAQGVNTDPLSTAIRAYASFEQETGIAAFRDSLISTPAAEVAA